MSSEITAIFLHSTPEQPAAEMLRAGPGRVRVFYESICPTYMTGPLEGDASEANAAVA
jgi:hypothetical protein